MTIFQRILVPVDGSTPAEAAIALALRLAKDWSSDLIFCNILDTDRIAAECASTAYGDPTPIIAAMEDNGRQLLSAASEKARGAGLASRTCLWREGDAVEGILELAKREEADLIVIGSHGRRGLSRLVMGSTTEGVLRVSPVPVLVVRQPRPETRRSASSTHSLAQT